MASPARDTTQETPARIRSWHLPDPDMTLFQADLRAILPYLAENSVSAVVTDPPYDLTAGKKGGSAGCREEGLSCLGTDSWDEACMLACVRLGLDYENGAAA